MTDRRRSPHEDCMAHSGVDGRLTIIISLVIIGIAIQAYAVKINQETREEMAEFGGKVAVIESRVSALERAIKEHPAYTFRQGGD